jgi:predicted transcriptional regulator
LPWSTPRAASEQVAPPEEFIPAATVRKSLASKDHIISMIDGKTYKTLRRHLSTHGLTDVQYRERYNLRPDYPMVSENYSLARREMTQKIGLGRKGRGGTPTPEPTPTKRTRRKATEADVLLPSPDIRRAMGAAF